MKKNLHLLTIAMFLTSTILHAQEVDSTADSTANSKVDESVSDAKPRRHRDKIKITDYTKSKYTSEKTEKEADQVELTLAMGIDKIINLEGYPGELKKEFFYVGNASVLSVYPVLIGKNRKEVVLKPMAKGETNVVIRDTKGNVPIIMHVVVAEQNIVRLMNELKDSLREVEGINISIEGTRIALTGEAITPNDYAQIVNVVTDRNYADVVSNRVTMSSVTLIELAKRIQMDIQVFAPTVQVRVLNGRLLLEGTVDNQGARDQALKRAELYLPTARVSDPINKDPNVEKNDKPLQIIQNFIQVQAPPPKRESKLVRVTVHFVELSKDFLRAFGFKWQPGFTADPSISIGTNNATGATSTSGAGGFTFAGTLSSLFPSLNSMQSAGYGRILKSVTSIVKSAELMSVTDKQYVPTISIGPQGQSGNGPAIEVGLDLKVTPTILQGQDVDLSVALDQTNIISKDKNGTPITAKHAVTTRLYLKSGEVGGVTAVNKQDVSTAFNRDDPNPGSFGASASGATTRPIFNLIRSKSVTRTKGEFVIFISPQIIDSASEGTEDLKKNYRIKSGN